MSITDLGMPDYTGQIYTLGQRVQAVEASVSGVSIAQASYNARLTALERGGGGSSGSTAWNAITGKPTTLTGYGITDAVATFSQLSGVPTTLAGYGITDAQSATGSVAWSRITSTPTTRAGYGITDAGDMLKSDNLSGLTNPTTARTNLGLGSLATQSGTFSGTSSGTNTGDQTTIAGNAGSATKLQTARTINGVSFDGTANITVPTGAQVTDITFPANFTAAGDIYIPADVAMTLAAGISGGTGTPSYSRATAAAPTTFNSVTLPVSLAQGDILKVSAASVTGYYFISLKRTA